MMKHVRFLWAAALGAGILLAGVAWATAQAKPTAESTAPAAKPDSPAKAEPKLSLGKRPGSDTSSTAVTTFPANVEERPKSFLVTGDLIAAEDSEVAGKVTGTVAKVFVERGDRVKPGDPLVELDSANARLDLLEGEAQARELQVRLGLSSTTAPLVLESLPEVESARASYELARSNYDRDRDLAQRKVISASDWDKSRTEYETARRRLELIRQQNSQIYQQLQTANVKVESLRLALQDHIVRSPFEGRVVERKVGLGEHLKDGDAVAQLVQVNPLKLVTTVPEQYAATVAQGSKVRFSTGAIPGRRFEATVSRISPALDQKSRSLTVECLVPNEDELLKPGLFATAWFPLKDKETVAKVPSNALRRVGDSMSLFVVRGGTVAEVFVHQVDAKLADGTIEVAGPVKSGEQVVADPTTVTDGIRIQ